MSDHDRLWYVADRQCLCPEDQHVLVLLGPDGTWRLMLAEPDHDCQDCPLPPIPEHERLGKLPRRVRARISPCHAIAKTTKAPCSNLAPVGQRYCTHHRHLEVS